jgi:hypothetical protein
MGFENHEDDGEILDAAKILFRKNQVFPVLQEVFPKSIDTKVGKRQTERHLDRMRNYFNATEKYFVREDMVKQATRDIMNKCLVCCGECASKLDSEVDSETPMFDANLILEDAVDTLGEFGWGQHMPYGNMWLELPVKPMNFLLRNLWRDASREWQDLPQIVEKPPLEQFERIGNFCTIDGYQIEKIGVLVIRDFPFYILNTKKPISGGITYFFVAQANEKLVASQTNTFPFPEPKPFYVPDCGITIAPQLDVNHVDDEQFKNWFGYKKGNNKSALQHMLYGLPVKSKNMSNKGFVLSQKTTKIPSVTVVHDPKVQNLVFKDNFFGITIAVVNKLLAQLNFSRLIEYQHSTVNQKSSRKRKKRGTVVTQPSDETCYKTIYLPKESAVVKASEKKESNAHNRKAFKVDGHTRCYPTDVTNCKRDHNPNNPRYVKCGWCDKHQRYCHTIFVKDQVRGNPKLGWMHREREVKSKGDEV